MELKGKLFGSGETEAINHIIYPRYFAKGHIDNQDFETMGLTTTGNNKWAPPNNHNGGDIHYARYDQGMNMMGYEFENLVEILNNDNSQLINEESESEEESQ
jgi:hypothetical protein